MLEGGLRKITFGMDWDDLGQFRLFDVPVLFPTFYEFVS